MCKLWGCKARRRAACVFSRSLLASGSLRADFGRASAFACWWTTYSSGGVVHCEPLWAHCYTVGIFHVYAHDMLVTRVIPFSMIQA